MPPHGDRLDGIIIVSNGNAWSDKPDLGSMDMGAVDESAYVAFSTPGGNIDTAFRLGARLYRVSDGAVIWSGVLNTVMKEGSDSFVFIRNTAKTIVERMAKDKIIP